MPDNTARVEQSGELPLKGELPPIAAPQLIDPAEIAGKISEGLKPNRPAEERPRAFDVLVNYLDVLTSEGVIMPERERYAGQVLSLVAKELLETQASIGVADSIFAAPQTPHNVSDIFLAATLSEHLDIAFSINDRTHILNRLQLGDFKPISPVNFPITFEALKAEFSRQREPTYLSEQDHISIERLWFESDKQQRHAKTPELQRIGEERISEGGVVADDYLLVVQFAKAAPELLKGSYIAYQLGLTGQILDQLTELPVSLFVGMEPAPIIKLAQIFDRDSIAEGLFLHRVRDVLLYDEEDIPLTGEQFFAADLSPRMQAQVIEVIDSSNAYKLLLELGELSPEAAEQQKMILDFIAKHEFYHNWDLAGDIEVATPLQLMVLGGSLAAAQEVPQESVELALASFIREGRQYEKAHHLLTGYLSKSQMTGDELKNLYINFQAHDVPGAAGAEVFATALRRLEPTVDRGQLLAPMIENLEWNNEPLFEGAFSTVSVLAELFRQYYQFPETIVQALPSFESSNIGIPLLVELAAGEEHSASEPVLRLIIEKLEDDLSGSLASNTGYRPTDAQIAKAALQVTRFGNYQQQAPLLFALFAESSDMHQAISLFLNDYKGDIEALSEIVALAEYAYEEARKVTPTIALVLHEMRRAQDAERILSLVMDHEINNELTSQAIDQIIPNAGWQLLFKHWATYGHEALERLITGHLDARERETLTTGFGISSKGIDTILSYAARRSSAPVQDPTLRHFFRSVLHDSAIADSDRISLAHAFSRAAFAPPVEVEVKVAASAGVLKYSSKNRLAWERYFEEVGSGDAYQAMLTIEGIPKQRLITAMFSRLKNGDFTSVIESLVARGGDTFFIPVWKQVLKEHFGEVSQVLNALVRVENLPPQVARFQYDQLREQNLASVPSGTLLLARSALILANVAQTEEVRRSWIAGTSTESQLTTLRSQAESDSLPLTISPERIVPHQPGTIETVARMFLLQVSSPKGLRQFASAMVEEQFSLQVNTLLVSSVTENHLSAELIKHLAREAVLMATRHQVNVKEVRGATEFKIWPVAQGPNTMVQVAPRIAKQTMAIIGGGPAALIAARFRHEMGYLPNSTTIFSQAPSLGGIWRQRNVVDEGHNTFRAASLFHVQLNAVEPRPGSEVVNFLDQLATDDIKSQLHQSEVTRVEFRNKDGKYAVFAKNGKNEVEVGLFDSVLVCTGNRKARPLNSKLMKTNVDSLERIPLERWQRELRAEEYTEFQNKSPTLIGLGNSTMAMIGEFIKMEEKGHKVHPRILTHLSLDLLHDPGKVVQTGDGEIQGPLFRNPSGLNRVAGDIERIQERMKYALDRGWIVSDVTAWQVTDKRTLDSGDLSITVSTKAGQLIIDHVPRIFGLIGYQNDPEMMARFGCKSDPATGAVKFDPRTGRVYEKTGAGNRMYVAGTAASSRSDRNHEVIPGMLRSIPLIMFSEMLAGE